MVSQLFRRCRFNSITIACHISLKFHQGRRQGDYEGLDDIDERTYGSRSYRMRALIVIEMWESLAPPDGRMRAPVGRAAGWRRAWASLPLYTTKQAPKIMRIQLLREVHESVVVSDGGVRLHPGEKHWHWHWHRTSQRNEACGFVCGLRCVCACCAIRFTKTAINSPPTAHHSAARLYHIKKPYAPQMLIN
jgi:hypothetical protein